YLCGIDASIATSSLEAGSVAGQTTNYSELTKLVGRRNSVARCQGHQLPPLSGKEWIVSDDEPVHTQIAERCEGSVDLAFCAGLQNAKGHTLRARCIFDAPDHAFGIPIVRIYEQSKRSSLRNQLGNQFQPLGDQLNGKHTGRLSLGRARLVTRPSWTGSKPTVKTIGIVEVAFFAAVAEGGPKAAIKSTLRLTRSEANEGSRS